MNAIEKALWFIESHFASEIVLEDLAKAGGAACAFRNRDMRFSGSAAISLRSVACGTRYGITGCRSRGTFVVTESLRKAGNRRHAICKAGAWPREVHSLPAPSCIT